MEADFTWFLNLTSITLNSSSLLHMGIIYLRMHSALSWQPLSTLISSKNFWWLAGKKPLWRLFIPQFQAKKLTFSTRNWIFQQHFQIIFFRSSYSMKHASDRWNGHFSGMKIYGWISNYDFRLHSVDSSFNVNHRNSLIL